LGYIGQVVQAVEGAQQGGFPPAGRANKHGDGFFRNLKVDILRDSVPSEYWIFRFWILILLMVYHCLRARARDRMMLARVFIPRTKTSSTRAVPYWIWMGIPGTEVEMTNR
jgi:hypothetical protein